MKIDERRVLVVGASSGVGRDIGESLAARGARVAFAARRADLVERAATATGERGVGLACDVTDEASCRSVVDRAVDALGGLDTLIYAAATGPLVDLKDADASTWRRALDVNLIGAALTTGAAIGHIEASGAGRALYLSSVTGSCATPWPGLGLYAVSKAALERMVDAWRIEHPAVRFTTIVLGPIATRGEAPTTFADSWNPEKAVECLQRWTDMGLMEDTRLVDAAELCEQVATILSGSASFPRVTLEPF
jgi:NAD(P)-dependent dehydrogenase (short-subunit alcohol dehydrogenase family)